MIDMSHTAHQEYPVEASLLNKCITFASKNSNVNPIVIRAIVQTEGGKIGTVSRNKNGSFDLGVMQINTIHLNDIKKTYPKVGAKELIYNPCVNIAIGTWLLKQRIDESSNYWVGVGNYHSKTPYLRAKYMKKIYTAIRKIIGK